MRTQKATTSEYRQLAQLTPRGVIAHFANRAINETTLTLGGYAISFAEKYFALVPQNQRRITVATGGDMFLDASANEKQVSRWINGKIHLPVEAMLPLIAALPEPYQHQCRVEITHQLGSMFVPLEKANETPSTEHFGELIAVAGACIAAGARIFADNKIDRHDYQYIPEFLRQTNELISQLTTISAACIQVVDIGKSEQ